MKQGRDKQNMVDKIVSLAKRRGFVFPGSEIYGGLANTWDFGPLGVELKNNIKKLWWEYFVHKREDVYGIDAAILMHPKTWEASGHLESFADPMVDCLECKNRFRADHLAEAKTGKAIKGWTEEKLTALIKKENIKCPECGERNFTAAREFNLMFKTSSGALVEEGREVYLRPETAQGIFVNFKQVLNSTHAKIPFGMAQIGKAFRNEITPGNFIFRTREFEQMELEYFCRPGKELEVYRALSESSMKWFLSLGVKKEHLRFREHSKTELSHYSLRTQDIEYKFPFGWGELCGIASRGDYDLRRHEQFSGADLKYLDAETKEKFWPYAIEPSFGVERTLMTVLTDAYHEEEAPTAEEGLSELRIVLRLHPRLAPVSVAVLPLLRKPELVSKAREIFLSLKRGFNGIYDETASIGKRYRRQDEIGTPFCATVDYETLKDNTVTLRERDSMRQERVGTGEVEGYLTDKLA